MKQKLPPSPLIFSCPHEFWQFQLPSFQHELLADILTIKIYKLPVKRIVMMTDRKVRLSRFIYNYKDFGSNICSHFDPEIQICYITRIQWGKHIT